MTALAADLSASPITMFGPDFPFDYDRWVRHADGLGSVPPSGSARRSRWSAAGSPGWSPRTS